MSTGPFDEHYYLMVEFPFALRISSILCHSPRQQQLDHIMETVRPYLKETYASHRRKQIKRVK